MIIIQAIKAFVTAPAGVNLLVVKVETSEPGLFGYGCATFTWRIQAVVTVIEEYLRPLLVGRDVDRIEDIWQLSMGSSYWRNGPVLNNALSGVDEALWDIKGKMAGMPLYSLWGGQCRTGLAVYRHVDGASPEQVVENVAAAMQEGFRHVRCQMGLYGGNEDGWRQDLHRPEGSPSGAYFGTRAYMKSVLRMLEHVRKVLGWDVELLHDIHERLPLADTLAFAKKLEPFELFFLEDALPPEQVGYFEQIRRHTTQPLAMGELFVNPAEWRVAVQHQWIDFIRVHISDIGGLTPAKKLAAFCEAYGVRTAFHGPNDLSPIGAAAQMHLDMAIPNFGIQEYHMFSQAERDLFPGCPTVRDGYAYLDSAAPGIGVGFDEKLAKRFGYVEPQSEWLLSRLPDGTAVRP